ncbi:MAG: 3-deoxy-D-manno-octulosonate 8-phosphate phosphatase [Bacteroidetes bacterium MED-G20]|nr:MAG: 3-deoxy-D-manno-octulosonate 8-phosphate phosphatase [Bacteroidetes bacterium MED-G20]|tara:strand:- start:73 stop:591 length:519 start_codon:yes stop_codon:yes gene_type:complete
MSYKNKLSQITTFIFDVDGVLTDGSVILESSGEMVRTMHTKDGYALQHAVKKGYHIVIISGGSSVMVKKRLEGLGVEHIYLGKNHKLPVLNEHLQKHNISLSQVIYMGDDIPDLPCLKVVGISSCPKDASVEVREVCDYISHINGGKGCVRDVLEQTMRIQNKWMDDDAYSW